MRHANKIAKFIKLKQAGLGSLAFPAPTVGQDPHAAGSMAVRPAPTLPFKEPSHGPALRTPALKQAKTNRGHSVFRSTVVYHESGLEQRVSALLRTYRNIKRLGSQYPMVEYADSDGVVRRHTFDFFIELTNGTRIAIAVKALRKHKEMTDLLDRIRAYGITGVGKWGRRTPGIADAIMLATDAEATYEQFENAYFILASRDRHDEAECARLHDLVRGLPGQFRFGQLLLNCASRAKRRTAIWRLIDLGVLEPSSSGRIDELSWLRSIH
ncbi:hypothetical protein RJJ37_07265 [Rhizobium redzepovicii]|uniref:TnsA endonuclease N-terminal domain-containing protein n=1 Tax=Rhizobium redzepovicii TaxID=2867518 RepID=A0AAW8NX08_9HYPH|nr:hypothetical protein [Rhizobium redzepovicii]MDR9759432.1 hypothetical protein [Rhizobium redzepovicii]